MQVMTEEPNTAHAADIPSITFLGVKVHRVDFAAALDAIRGFIRSGKPHIIVTADASGIVLAQRDEEYRRIVNNADLVTPDSMGILWGARKLGAPLIERVCGVDIARALCEISGQEDFSVFFLGAAPGVAESAADNLKSEFPGLRVAGVHDGYFGPDEDAEVVAKVRESGAKVLLVAMGIPKQEKWIAAHLNELGVCVAMGVGGSFDVFSGKVKRAPLWMQRRGLEWLYRLVSNPRKIGKVMTLPRFVWLVWRAKRG